MPRLRGFLQLVLTVFLSSSVIWYTTHRPAPQFEGSFLHILGDTTHLAVFVSVCLFAAYNGVTGILRLITGEDI